MSPFYAGHFPGRGAWVAAGYQDGKPSQLPLIFKLSWTNRAKKQLEEESYDLAHRDGWIPGLTRPLLWSNPGIQIYQNPTLVRPTCLSGIASYSRARVAHLADVVLSSTFSNPCMTCLKVKITYHTVKPTNPSDSTSELSRTRCSSPSPRNQWRF
jgi:hypothetical protein